MRSRKKKKEQPVTQQAKTIDKKAIPRRKGCAKTGGSNALRYFRNRARILAFVNCCQRMPGCIPEADPEPRWPWTKPSVGRRTRRPFLHAWLADARKTRRNLFETPQTRTAQSFIQVCLPINRIPGSQSEKSIVLWLRQEPYGWPTQHREKRKWNLTVVGWRRTREQVGNYQRRVPVNVERNCLFNYRGVKITVAGGTGSITRLRIFHRLYFYPGDYRGYSRAVVRDFFFFIVFTYYCIFMSLYSCVCVLYFCIFISALFVPFIVYYDSTNTLVFFYFGTLVLFNSKIL